MARQIRLVKRMIVRDDRKMTNARTHVVSVLAAAGTVSRAELARRTGLAPSTVSAVIGELERAGLVAASPGAIRPEPAGVGRPPVLVALSRRAGVALGIDFGKRHVRVAVSDLAHALLAERHRAIDADLPAAEAIELARGLVGEVLDEAGVAGAEIVGVGMGLPGPVHLPSGELGDSTILPGWVGVRAAEAMSAALGHPVEVGNDANLGALAESIWGAGRGVAHLAYVKLATGVGAGLIVNGRPYVGAGGTAGELGHTIVDPTGPICRCGNRGCLETVAGTGAVERALRETYGAGFALADAIERALAGDAGCRRAIADAGEAVGLAVSMLCNLFNPARIVVGGELAAAGDVLLEPLRRALRRGAIRSAADDAEVVTGSLGDRAEVLGAVGLVLRRGAPLASSLTPAAGA
jgi:predicted NBD/HSP70 family sugar kinase